jgi:hypothetical protein
VEKARNPQFELAEICATVPTGSMASPFTRSSKRNEGLTTRSTRAKVAFRPSNDNRQQLPNVGRKRPRDSLDHEEKAISNKKLRISIEITSRPKIQPKTRSVKSNASSEIVPALRTRTSPPKKAETPAATQTEAPSPPSRKTTNHHEKVVNGIKHELDRLQPNAADLKDEKRKLRSQEGTRFKSELSQYFPEYDEVIGNDPKEDRKLHNTNLEADDFEADLCRYSKC